MKEIKAYIRPLCAGRVLNDLESDGAKDLSLIRVDAFDPSMTYQGPEGEATAAKSVTRRSSLAKLELVCRDDEAKLFVEIIKKDGHTGAKGDGKILVIPVEAVLDISNGETGDMAL
jgi:nitrogen regulatory protein P-II 1